LESAFNPKICETCGDPVEMQIEILNRMRIVPVMCSCKKAAYEKKKQESEQQERQLRLEQIINNSLMDKQFRENTFDNWNYNLGNPKMLTLGKRYIEKFQDLKKQNMGLMIYGNPGNGKTHVVSCIANALIDRMTPCICVSINSLLDRIKLTYKTYGREGESEVINGLNNAELLIIDDLGTEQDTEWSRSMIYNIIDSRYRIKKPLIITTNVPKENLEERYYARTYNRIIEICTPVENKWTSIREQKGREKTKILEELMRGD
jgi:DNA replication protein DnaC